MLKRVGFVICAICTLCGFSFENGSFEAVPNFSECLNSREQTEGDQFAEIRSKIRELVDTGEIPSYVVLVARGGTVLWEEAFGWADINNKIPATPDTIYCVGSMSKSITATGMMVLVEKGLIDLDAPVNNYLSPARITVYEGRPEDVTIRHLLNGAAAIPHGWYSHHEKDKPLFLEADEYIKRFGFTVYKPGEEFLYSNHAFGLASHIIAKVSGRTYEDFMKAHVFEPLGMKHTTQYIGKDLRPHAAEGYVTMDEKMTTGTMIGPAGGAGLYSSARDLLRYGLFNLKVMLPNMKKIVRDETLDLMHSYKNPKIPQGFLTLGWGGMKDPDGEFSLLLSNGEVTGANATIALLPKQNIVVICLSNIAKNPSISDRFAFEILEKLAPGFEDYFANVMDQWIKANIQDYKPQPHLSGRWSGLLKSSAGEKPVSMVFQEDGKIKVTVSEEPETTLTNLGFETGMLTGSCRAIVLGDDKKRSIPFRFYLKIDEDRIYGYYLARGSYISETTGEKKSVAHTGYISLSRLPDSQ